MIEHLKLAGGSVETTPNHRFYTIEHGWIAASALRPGDHILRQSGSTAAVEGFTVTFKPTTTYDLTVADVHDFFVGSGQVLAHNCPMLGEGGTQITSKTLYRGDGFWIDVENPAPGVRPGQLHVQTPAGDKYIYDLPPAVGYQLPEVRR